VSNARAKKLGITVEAVKKNPEGAIKLASAQAVTKGAALLDKKMPGWANDIDLGLLKLSSNVDCVLGQLFSDPQTVKIQTPAGVTVDVCDANFELGAKLLGLAAPGPNDYVESDYEKAVIYGFEAFDTALPWMEDEPRPSYRGPHGSVGVRRDWDSETEILYVRNNYQLLDDLWKQEVYNRQT
jgi:hypothetical protein